MTGSPRKMVDWRFLTDRKQLQSCAIGAKSMLVSVMGWRTVLISNTEAFGWGGSVLGDMLRDMKQLRARFELSPILSDNVGGSGSPTLWPSAVFRFARFRVMGIPVAEI